MAKTKKFGYVEPAAYFPPEVWEKLQRGDYDKKDDEKENMYREESKRMIEKQKKRKEKK